MISGQQEYLFCSQRLGFRKWTASDVPHMAEISADPEVMRFFPSTHDISRTVAFIKAMNEDFDIHGYCYYAVDELSSASFIGFIGLKWIELEIEPYAFTDIGWRLKSSAWGRGLATEGALCCLRHGLHTLNLKEIYAIAPKVNHPSISVMEKAGMSFIKDFNHPKLKGEERLQKCVLYSKNKEP
jgi:RimJ/RimL family protein N-acetyltransferase